MFFSPLKHDCSTDNARIYDKFDRKAKDMRTIGARSTSDVTVGQRSPFQALIRTLA